ncbi:MAG TPA: glycosyltransferase family 4 protein [Sulfurovum sp.]|jgi:glycosyltransferase involved in cell wall biosynthesis|nr:MAG: hypothetical protein B7Y63_05820 [Sulfurovum sp. 35-42-20]OYZ26433.1 MAG: hypothetical protein B7Y23_01755 [Sulfurovum sp. 16-42-52]OYZ48559.1 MAG: hypothetical protein B7Y13_07345 [Sulfurovum sp. 24-42-9]OZA46365.1 MAG: hypothetical protein B7X80_02800 [Sulfurovum sp. 17-42-90]HQS71846.1 glycosyltransferase family 4 protein [Sulfurovum sp.]
MNIWIFNHYALTPDMSGGTRHYDFAKELVKRGHKVTIVASSFHYAKYQEMKIYDDKEYIQENIDGIDFIWIKTSPYFGNGVARVKNMLGYTYKVLRFTPKLDLKAPDIIIGSSVHLFAVYAAYRLSKKYNTPFIMEVRDLWPQTLIDMGVSRWHPFVLVLGWLECYLYRRADTIITVLPRAVEYIKRYTDPQKVVWISNGFSCTETTLHEKKLSDEKFNILYAGTHGLANDLEVLIDTALYLRHETHLHFTLMGEGPRKRLLQEKAEAYHLNNITFLPMVQKSEVMDYLKSADLLYVGLKDLPLYRYGMSMNKIFEYMAAKKPVLFVSNIDDNLIISCNAGKVVKNYKVEEVAKTIQTFSKMLPKQREVYAKNGYECVQQHFSIEVLTDKMESVLKQWVKV